MQTEDRHKSVFRITASDYPCGIFKLSLEYMILYVILYVHNSSLTNVQYDVIV